MAHQTFAAREIDEIAFEADQAARRDDRFDRDAISVMIHGHDFTFARRQGLEDIAEVIARNFDV